MLKFFRFGFLKKKQPAPLAFEGLNPLLAKQLSEVESQIGQLVQARFDIARERAIMQSEMAALKSAMQTVALQKNESEKKDPSTLDETA